MPDDTRASERLTAALPNCDALAEALAARAVEGMGQLPRWLLVVGPGEHAPGELADDALGHRLRASVRARDLVCSLGQAGYAVLLTGAQAADAGRVAARLPPVLGAPVAIVRVAPGETPAATLDRLRGASPLAPPEPSLVAPSP